MYVYLFQLLLSHCLVKCGSDIFRVISFLEHVERVLRINSANKAAV